MRLEKAKVLVHDSMAASHRRLILRAPLIAAAVRPGQFVHVRIPHLEGSVLRRPFSVCGAEGDTFSLLYKPVGRGTLVLVRTAVGDEMDVMGPLGNGFPEPAADRFPVAVAGGYGVAPLGFLAGRIGRPGLAFVGGATTAHILCLDAFERAGWKTRIATMDGSLGTRGLVTDVARTWLADADRPAALEFYACGPDAMLKTVADLATETGSPAWVSMDKHMACGVGACLACVQRIRADDGAVNWLRTCREGPVFDAKRIVWETP